MARKLSVKQRVLLQGYAHIFDVNDMPQEDQDRLEKMNDYETLWQDANRFLGDQYRKIVDKL